MERFAIILALVTALPLGCTTYVHPIDEPDPFDAGTDSDTDSDTGSETSSDTGVDTDTASGPCTAVDILLVVENTCAICEDLPHDSLAEAVPAFVGALWEWLPSGTSVHVGLTTGDFSNQPSCSSAYVNCVPEADTIDSIPSHYTTPEVLTTAKNGGQGRLFVHDDLAYFEAEPPDGVDEALLSLWLMGAVDAMDKDGCSLVMHAAAAGWAANPANDATNAGFIRDAGAVLLIVFVADYPDLSPDSLESYKAMIASAKSECGIDECTVAAGLTSYFCDAWDSPWSPVFFLELFGEEQILGYTEEPGDYPLVLGDDLAQQVAQVCGAIGPG